MFQIEYSSDGVSIMCNFASILCHIQHIMMLFISTLNDLRFRYRYPQQSHSYNKCLPVKPSEFLTKS